MCFGTFWHLRRSLVTSSLYAAVHILAERFYILGKNTFLIYKKIAPKKGRDKSRYHPVSCYLNNRHSDCVTCRDVVFYFIFKNAAHVGNSFPALTGENLQPGILLLCRKTVHYLHGHCFYDMSYT